MTRVAVKGLIVTDLKSVTDVKSGNQVEVPSIPILDLIFARISNAIDGYLDDTNMAAKGITAASIADSTITAAKIVAGTLTSALMADGVGQTTSGSYVGDSATANRVVSVGFTPRFVLVVRTDGTFLEFTALANGGTTTFYYRDATGAQAASTANWQGVTSGGFKLGTNAAGTSNITGVVYQYVAWK